MDAQIIKDFVAIANKIKSKHIVKLFGDNAIQFIFGLEGHLTSIDTSKEIVTSIRRRNTGYSEDPDKWEFIQAKLEDIQYLTATMTGQDIMEMIGDGSFNKVFSKEQQEALKKMVGDIGDDLTPYGYEVDSYGNLVKDPTNDGKGTAQGVLGYQSHNNYGVHIG